MTFQGPGQCKGCERYYRALVSGYCPYCDDLMREATQGPDDWGSLDDVELDNWIEGHYTEEQC